jgi:hypothetical protein
MLKHAILINDDILPPFVYLRSHKYNVISEVNGFLAAGSHYNEQILLREIYPRMKPFPRTLSILQRRRICVRLVQQSFNNAAAVLVASGCSEM